MSRIKTSRIIYILKMIHPRHPSPRWEYDSLGAALAYMTETVKQPTIHPSTFATISYQIRKCGKVLEERVIFQIRRPPHAPDTDSEIRSWDGMDYATFPLHQYTEALLHINRSAPTIKAIRLHHDCK